MSIQNKMRVLSGIQPSGSLHLGNYFGMMSRMIQYQSENDLLVHDKYDKNLAMLVCEMTYNESLPTPFGVFYVESKPTYDEMFSKQIEGQVESKGKGKLKDLIYTKDTWVVN